MKKIVWLWVAVMAIWALPASAGSPKRELRAAWIATVANIDWPSSSKLTSAEQQAEFIRLLDELQYIGCNAVIVQIRPVCDACYPCEKEPWSRYLTGTQGTAPTPYYDPLAFMITETHKRNMEFHAWFNPYRALMDCNVNPNPPDHVTRKHKDWCINYGGKTYLDPGNPDVQQYTLDIINNVVKTYDIDAVHLDDYFYPYREAGKPFPDDKSYKLYGKGQDREDWRRSNTTQFIRALAKQIKKTKPYVKFGVSPFGVWRNKSKDPEGSETKGGQTNYDDLFADVLLWTREGYLDYIMPQLYWEHASNIVSYSVLLPWWLQHGYGRHVYIGLGVYRMLPPAASAWRTEHEILWQINDLRAQCTTAPGYGLYSSSCFHKIKPTLADSLHSNTCASIALPPTMPWIDSVAPSAPQNVAIAVQNQKYILRWQPPHASKETLKYAVYCFAPGEKTDLNNASKNMQLTAQNQIEITEAKQKLNCTFVVTALDRLWNESLPSNSVILK